MPTARRSIRPLPSRRRPSRRSGSGPGPRWGHIGATSHPSVTDNTGHERPLKTPAQHLSSVSIAGPVTTLVLSRTEEVRGSNPLTSTPTTVLVTGLADQFRRAGVLLEQLPGQQTGSNRARYGTRSAPSAVMCPLPS
jgi:hypothetical protein